MADAKKFAEWLVANQDKQGTPEFETVSAAFRKAKAEGGEKPKFVDAPISPIRKPEELTWAEKNIAPILENAPGIKDILRTVPEKLTRGVVQGGADPVIGTAQLAANAASPLVEAIPLLKENLGTGEDMNLAVRRQNEEYEAKRGSAKDSVDPYRMTGNVLGSLLPFSKLGVGGNLAQKVGTGMLAGGGGALTAPVTSGESFANEKGKQLVGGLTVGGVIPLLGAGASAVGGVAKSLIEPLLPGGAGAIYQRFVQKAAGDKRAEIVDALRNAKEFVSGSKPTAGEAMSEIPEATILAAHQKALSRSQSVSPEFARRYSDQQGAREAAISTISGTEDDLVRAIENRRQNAAENYGSIMDRRVDPRSLVQITDEAVADKAASKAAALQEKGKFQTFAADQQSRADDFVPVPGMPRVPGRVSNFPERVAEGKDAARDAGGVYARRRAEEDFLRRTSDLLRETAGNDKALTPLLDRPSIMNVALKEAIEGARETGRYFPKEKGDKFSIYNLQRIKEALDDMTRDPETFGIKATQAKEIGDTRKAFVTWLENRSPEWKKARLQYAEDSRPINEMNVGKVLKDALVGPREEERATAYATAMRNAPQTIKKSGSQQGFERLDQVLSPKNEGVVDAILEDLLRKQRYERLASQTKFPGADAIESSKEGLKPPNLLSRAAMLTNFGLKLAKSGVDEKINKIAGEANLNPATLADILEGLPPSEAQLFVQAIIERSRNPAIAGVSQTGARE